MADGPVSGLQSPAASSGNWRRSARSIAVGIALVLAVAWLGLLGLGVLTYSLMAAHFHVAVTWDLLRWNTWGIRGRTDESSSNLIVSGIWWILLPVLVAAAALLAARLRPPEPAACERTGGQDRGER